MGAYYNYINNFCHTSDRQINLPSDNDEDFYGSSQPQLTPFCTHVHRLLLPL